MKHHSLSGLLVLLLISPVLADRIPPSPVALRVAQAQVVVVGKVTALEPQTVKAGGAEFRIAVVKVEDAILGVKGLTHVKVGFVPSGGGRVGREGFLRNLEKDMRVLLFLTPQADGAFYQARNYFDMVLDQNAGGFAAEVGEAKRCGKLLADPLAGLKAKDAEDRYLTAAMLLTRNRTNPGGKVRQEAVPVAESKLILQALADADWTMNRPRDFRLMPQQVFNAINPTPADGFTRPADFKEFETAAKKWLRDNAEKYRLKRFVADAEK